MWKYFLYFLSLLGLAFMGIMIGGIGIITREIFNLHKVEGFTDATSTFTYPYTQNVMGTCNCIGPGPNGSSGIIKSFPYSSNTYLMNLTSDEINVIRISVIMYWIFIIAIFVAILYLYFF